MNWIAFLDGDLTRRDERLRYIWTLVFSAIAVIVSLLSFLFWQRPSLSLLPISISLAMGSIAYLLVGDPLLKRLLRSVDPRAGLPTELWHLKLLWRLVKKHGIPSTRATRNGARSTAGILAAASLGAIFFELRGPLAFTVLLAGMVVLLHSVTEPTLLLLRSFHTRAFAQALAGGLANLPGWSPAMANKDPELREIIKAAAREGERPSWQRERKRTESYSRVTRVGGAVVFVALIEVALIAALFFIVGFATADKIARDASFGMTALAISAFLCLCVLHMTIYCTTDMLGSWLNELRLMVQLRHSEESDLRRAYEAITVLNEAQLFVNRSILLVLADLNLTSTLQEAADPLAESPGPTREG